ncbi:MAG: O-antigen translocase [Flavobacteriaceae bacterium]|nr:O-antigen translocase [Flavobacteriaceae bacterium]
MKTPKFLRNNLLLKMTSLNAVVIGIRLIISLFVQREIFDIVGKAGYAKIGSLRNLVQILTSFTSLGVFNGIVKYVAEYKSDKQELQKLFSTTLVFTIIGSVLSSTVLLIFAESLSQRFFFSTDFAFAIKLVAVIVPFIAIQRVFNGVVNGLSKYKHFAKIEMVAYILAAGLTLYMLYTRNLDGVLIAIAVTPAIQVAVMIFFFIKVLREYVQFSELKLKVPYAKNLLAFALMSFFSTVLLNQLEIEIRRIITLKVTEDAAGVWTGLNFVSKNYMVFSNALFTLYVLPKFASIHNFFDFKVEVKNIFKTLLPLFGLGMLLVYFGRNIIIFLIYPDAPEMAPLFKWQLMGDFVRLASLILAHQFLAKKLVRSFIFTELLSLGLFFILSHYLVDLYGIEGVPIAHFIRYIVYFVVVFFVVMHYFRRMKSKPEPE